MTLRFAGFEFDRTQAELRGADGEIIKLRAKTVEMLALLVANSGQLLSKQQLMQAVWPNVHVGEDSLFQCIRELRLALGDDKRQLIKLVSGRGYMFTADVTTIDKPVREAAEPVEPAGHDETPLAPALDAETLPELTPPPTPIPARPSPGLRRLAIIAGVAGAGAIVGLAVAAPMLKPALFKRPATMVTVMPIAGAADDAQVAAMALGITHQLTDGLARIDNIRVVAPRVEASAGPAARAGKADFVVSGELSKGEQAWTLKARLVRTADNEVLPAASISVDFKDIDTAMQQSRLTAGIGHALALRLNAQVSAGAAGSPAPSASARAAIDQSTASILQTTRERFAAGQTMLEKALTDDPDNIDVAVALAALQLRGIMMVWYSPEDSAAAEVKAGAILERALRARPDYIPVLQTQCRFLTATNRFVEALVACARALSFDEWNGLVLYHIGLSQIQLGRFADALATFEQADRFDTPDVSRWTWLLGAGWANAMMGRCQEALPWLQRSIAITPASGRTHMLMAGCYQLLGRTEEAKATMQIGMQLRPGTTAANVRPPPKNASPVFLEASERFMKAYVEAGLPAR